MTRFIYSPEELLSRPVEHVLECLSCRELAGIIGCSRTIAWEILHGDRELTDLEARSLRRWLEAKAGARARVPALAGGRAR